MHYMGIFLYSRSPLFADSSLAAASLRFAPKMRQDACPESGPKRSGFSLELVLFTGFDREIARMIRPEEDFRAADIEPFGHGPNGQARKPEKFREVSDLPGSSTPALPPGASHGLP